MNAAVVVLVGAAVAGACTVATTVGQVDSTGCVLHSVTVTPPDTTVRVGDTLKVVASLPACGGPLPQFVWQSSDATVATVDSLGGLVRTLKRGSASIIAIDVRDTTLKGAMALQVAP